MVYKNNPFNIRYSKDNDWLGQTDPFNGFCTFCDMNFGVRAFVKLMKYYITVLKLRTIREIITRYAPPSENNTSRYVEFVKEQMCFNETSRLSLTRPLDFYRFCHAVALFESNFDLSSGYFDSAYSDVLFDVSNDLFNY